MAVSGLGSGIPAALPGDRLDAEVVAYLRSGAEAAVVIPDAAGKSVRTIRVVAERQ